MIDSPNPEAFFVESVFHPTDFSEASESAFAHALAIALVRRSSLTLMHAGSEHLAADEWTKFPGVRATLERWGLLEAGRPRSAVFEEFEVAITKASMKGKPLRAALDHLESHPTELIVLATDGRDGVARWLRDSVAERIARRSRTMTLFVPSGVPGFVSVKTGDVSLRKILVPIDNHPSPNAALIYATRAASMAAGERVEVEMLHVGSGQPPPVAPPQVDGCHWSASQRDGNVVDEIVAAAEETSTDLIVMATHGHDGILDVLRGSVTEQVLRRSPCPLLAVPS